MAPTTFSEKAPSEAEIPQGNLSTPSLHDPMAEKCLLRKLDLHILPPLFTLFLLAFLDRTNIGNARIQGLTEDLHLHGSAYNTALLTFFIPYILFEIPSNLVLRALAPSTWLSLTMILWGIATIGQGLITTLPGLIAHAMYYRRYELQRRLSLFFAASILAGAFGGLFAYALAHLHGVGGYAGWRWIFIVEGLLTVVVGVAARWWVVDWPETARFLTPAERELLIERLARDTDAAAMDRLDRRAVRRIAGDVKMYIGVVMYFGVVNTGYAGAFFVPTIIRELGYTAAAAQVRSIPVFVVATVVSLGAAVVSDRVRRRYWFCMGGLGVASVGYVLLLCQRWLSVGVRYFALFLVVPGGFVTQPITLVWVANTMSGHYKRAVSTAVMVGLGNAGGIVASSVFLDREMPRYPTGYGVSLGLLWVCGAACTVFLFVVKRENGKRDRGERDHRLERTEDADNLGDDHPRFRFAT
ncbi:MFS general substrate transporter [Lophium mytilinum]|uniref:MFS general substrate transporter n=1 Tax=Lophium mytilinum TaxID=390894 RepID=A0A6A6RAU9_9PEZI|nr:MFS general substrate transporter [Lophium mytilinum]